MKKTARWIAVCMAMIMGFLVVGCDNGSNESDEPNEWFIEKGTLKLYRGTAAEAKIPEGVTGIGKHAFSYCDGLERVIIPASVTVIEDYAFSGCTGLKSVEIPEGVTSIGKGAFKDCTSLENVTIPCSVENISGYYNGGGAFEGCTSLKSVTISKGVTSIGFSTFSRCTSLKSVTIPDGVKSIESWAFDGCSLETIQYGGTKDEWEKIEGLEDSELLDASITITYKK